MSLPVGDFFYVPENEAQALDDLRSLLRLPAGRRLFRRLLSAGNALNATMCADARHTEYQEGRRAVGLWLATRLETAAPGELARLLLESVNDRQTAEAGTARRKHDG